MLEQQMKQEQALELEDYQKPIVPEQRWGEIAKAKQGKWVVVEFEMVDWEEKLLNGFFRALEWMECPVKVEMDKRVMLFFGQGLTWREAQKMKEWKRDAKS